MQELRGSILELASTIKIDCFPIMKADPMSKLITEEKMDSTTSVTKMKQRNFGVGSGVKIGRAHV